MANTRRRNTSRYRQRSYNMRRNTGEDGSMGVTIAQILITTCIVSALYFSTLWDGAGARYLREGARAVLSENIETDRAVAVMADIGSIKPIEVISDYLLPWLEGDTPPNDDTLGEAILTQNPSIDLPIDAQSEGLPYAAQDKEVSVETQGGEGVGEFGTGGMLAVDGGKLTPPDSVLTTPVYLSARLNTPVEGAITSPFGFRTHPITGKPDFHTGIDIAANKGADILAALQGTVTQVSTSAIYGKYVVLGHGGGVETSYSHCDQIIVREGQRVGAGARIATVGSTGISTGPHLHFELLIDGLKADPLPHLRAMVAG